MKLEVVSGSAEETEHLGGLLARLLHPGAVVALVGNLGSGKTCLARGIARGLGIQEPITSPTFILVGEYLTPAGYTLYHVDCYRLEDPVAEGWDIGLVDLMEGHGICVIEWAERIQSLLPSDHLRITFAIRDAHTRQVSIEPTGSAAQAIIAELHHLLARTRATLCV